MILDNNEYEFIKKKSLKNNVEILSDALCNRITNVEFKNNKLEFVIKGFYASKSKLSPHITFKLGKVNI